MALYSKTERIQIREHLRDRRLTPYKVPREVQGAILDSTWVTKLLVHAEMTANLVNPKL